MESISPAPPGLSPEIELVLLDPPESDPRRSPDTTWVWWTAFLALLGGFVLATVGGLLVDIPAVLLGAKLTGGDVSPGLSIADTVVQDVGFVVAAVYCAKLGGRVARSWQFGLRRPGDGWWRAGWLVVALIVAFVIASVLWSEVFNPEKEKLLQQLGSNESTALLLLSAALTCVVAPMCEEFLFRGFIYSAIRNWRGPWPAALITGLLFGLVHGLSAPAADLLPLAFLGVILCVVYELTGSLYPCILVHLLNNTIAFGSDERWSFRIVELTIASLVAVSAVLWTARRFTPLVESTAPAATPGGE